MFAEKSKRYYHATEIPAMLDNIDTTSIGLKLKKGYLATGFVCIFSLGIYPYGTL